MKISSLKVYSLKYIHLLLQMCVEEQKKKTCNAIVAMQQEFLENLLPEQKLQTFFKRTQDLDVAAITDNDLLNFYFQHELKIAFGRYVEVRSGFFDDRFCESCRMRHFRISRNRL